MGPLLLGRTGIIKWRSTRRQQPQPCAVRCGQPIRKETWQSVPKDMRFTFGNIQADEDGYCWLLNGVERRDRNDTFDVLEGDLKDISATHLRQMYRRLHKHLGEDCSPSDMVIHTGEMPSEFDLRDLPLLPTSDVKFSFKEGEILVVVECYLSMPSYDHEGPQIDLTKLNAPPPGLDIVALIDPLLGRKRFSLVDVDAYNYSDDDWEISVGIGFNPRSRMLFDLYHDAREIKALIEASSGGVTHKTVTDLIRGGHVKALLGQPEGDWLEAKRQHADFESEVGKIRLAQWVAQFANSPEGGVVVLGLATKNQGNGDVITKITPLPREPGVRRKYVQVLDTKVIPPIEKSCCRSHSPRRERSGPHRSASAKRRKQTFPRTWCCR